MSKTALLLIDTQNDVLRGVGLPERQAIIEASFQDAIERLSKIKQQANASAIPVVIVQHAGKPGHRLEVDSRGWQVHEKLTLTERDVVISKTTSDSFHETSLENILKESGVDHLVIGGFLTQYCLDLSIRRAVSLGFSVTLISDGHSTCDESGITFDKIIAHHNNILPVLNIDGRTVEVKAAEEIVF